MAKGDRLPSRLVLEIDEDRREKLRKIAAISNRTMKEMIVEFIDSLPDPPRWEDSATAQPPRT